MRSFWLMCLGCACLIMIIFIGGEGRGEQKWRTYKGAWFEINYPSSFTVKPSQKSKTKQEGYDSVYFISPDNNVEFYVFSPQWNGEARDIEINPNIESLIDQNTDKSKSKAIRWFTAKAKDNSYLRAVSDETIDNTRLVFGIKYKNKAIYDKYHNDYIVFKKSLRQFADGETEVLSGDSIDDKEEKILYFYPASVHLGDEQIPDWPSLHGTCFEVEFRINHPIQILTFTLQTYGLEITAPVYLNNHKVAVLPPQVSSRGEKTRPNKWSKDRFINIPTDKLGADINKLRICTDLGVRPQFAGDKDDFQIRNLRLTWE